MIPVPENMPLLVGVSGSGRAGVVERILKGEQTDLKTNLFELGRYWKVKVWFNEEIDIRVQSHVIKKEFKDGIKDIPYKVFVIVHEIGHCVDHLDKVSFSKKWQAISGWKKCDRDKKIPEGYKRYIEKRKGRELAGPKTLPPLKP